jgi:hypothetical protein
MVGSISIPNDNIFFNTNITGLPYFSSGNWGMTGRPVWVLMPKFCEPDFTTWMGKSSG